MDWKYFYDFVIFGIVDNGVMLIGAFFGLGLEKYLPSKLQVGLGAVIGAGIGIGRIGGSALEAMARQPELTGKIQTVMLIAAALIEGIGFAALFAV